MENEVEGPQLKHTGGAVWENFTAKAPTVLVLWMNREPVWHPSKTECIGGTGKARN